jgi:predicted phosphatase
MSFDLDHTLWDFDKNSEIFEVSFREITHIEIKTFIEKICADKSGVLEVVSI